MKIIDIFNKIANKEEVPNKVKFNNEIYTYKPEWNDYSNKEGTHGLFADVISNSYQITRMLDEEIEIIEEDKKIEKLKREDFFDNFGGISINDDKFIDKINELIDEANKSKEVNNE